MAFTEANENKIVKILKITPLALESQILGLGDRLTAQVQTDVEAEITRWDAGVSTNFVNIEAREKNFGASLSSEAEKNDIRSNIASLLERPDWAQNSGGNVMKLERG